LLSWYKKLRKAGYGRISSLTSAIYNCQYYDKHGVYLEKPNTKRLDLILYFIVYWHHPRDNFMRKK
jgi:hypothetical protein